MLQSVISIIRNKTIQKKLHLELLQHLGHLLSTTSSTTTSMTNSSLTFSTSLANSLSTTPSKIKNKFLGVANVRVANERKKGVADDTKKGGANARLADLTQPKNQSLLPQKLNLRHLAQMSQKS